MSKSILTNTPDLINYQKVKPFDAGKGRAVEITKTNPVLGQLFAENSDWFVSYIEWLGLAEDPKMVVLASQHHYFYDAEEMINVKTVVNIKELNQIKNISSFLHSLSNILQSNTYLIGCFVDNKKVNSYKLRKNLSEHLKKRRNEDIENGIVSKYPLLNMLISVMDSKINKFLTKESVRLLLNDSGFEGLDFTDLNGTTYFCAQKNKAEVN
jgi:hypothetical protein